MKLATASIAGERRVGIVDMEERSFRAFDLPIAEAARGVAALIGRDVARVPTLSPVALGSIVLEAPLPRPRRNIFCVGKNYREHAVEFSRSGFDSSAAQGDVPSYPIVFSKVPDCVIADGEPVEIHPSVSSAVDYEAELAVIIGRGGRGIAATDALDHVFGYTMINDVTARDLQGRHSQWLIGKSLDTFCPMGPWVVTRDAIDLSDTSVRCWVNDELRQDSNTNLLIFDVGTIIETISAGIELHPGDVIATGTPSGVGIGFDPPRYLQDGDVVRVEIAGIGSLSNPVKAMPA